MDYLYYSLYQFYTKVIKVQKNFAPVINIAGVIALVQMALIFSIINAIIYLDYGKEVAVPYHGLLPGVVGLVLYYFNEKHFRKKESDILKKIGLNTDVKKWCIVISSFMIIALILWFWMEDGLYRIICFLIGREANLL